eukprot:scaffold14815_cov221-Alexandrium_tamarense.AAC.4
MQSISCLTCLRLKHLRIGWRNCGWEEVFTVDVCGDDFWKRLWEKERRSSWKEQRRGYTNLFIVLPSHPTRYMSCLNAVERYCS